MRNKPRLTVELVPLPAWRRNVRAVVATETWDELRWVLGATQLWPRHFSTDYPDRLFQRRKLTCAYCKIEQKILDLHEEWRFDDNKGVQRLVGLRPICPQCHLAKHLGYASRVGRIAEAVAQLRRVNAWSALQAKDYIDRAFAKWERRSGNQYSLDVRYLERFITPRKIHLDWLENPRVWVGSRLEAIMWAQYLLDSDAVIVDTETTGLLEKSNVEVIELAAINMKGKVVYQSLFKPRYRIPQRVIKIHGITNEDVKSSPLFAQQAEDIASALHGRTIVTFNARFDREVIGRTFRQDKLEGVSARWECAMHAYRTFSGSGPYLALPGKSHRALADCKATLRLIKRMAKAR